MKVHEQEKRLGRLYGGTGNWSTQRKPTQIPREHVISTQKGSAQIQTQNLFAVRPFALLIHCAVSMGHRDVTYKPLSHCINSHAFLLFFNK